MANGVTKILKTVLTKGTGFGNSLDGGRPLRRQDRYGR